MRETDTLTIEQLLDEVLVDAKPVLRLVVERTIMLVVAKARGTNGIVRKRRGVSVSCMTSICPI